MCLMTQAYLLQEYGPRLNAEQLAKVLGITVVALHTQRSKGTLGVRTYSAGGRIWADYRDVAAYFDEVRQAVQHAGSAELRQTAIDHAAGLLRAAGWSVKPPKDAP